ncbi:MAG TPA: pre-toxin TG domain-containing protein, partial [Candidatus Brocadiaceae bacterium]
IWAVDLDGLEAAMKYPDGTIYWPRGCDRLGFQYPPGGTLIGVDYGGVKFTDNDLSLVLDFIPGVGQAKGLIEAATGKDLVTGKKLSTLDRTLGVFGYVGKVKKIIKIEKAAEKVDKVNETVTAANKIDDAKATEKGIVQNKKAGDLREAAEEAKLKQSNPGADVQNQRYLRDKDGKIVKDPVTGEGRRIDHVVIKDKKAVDAVETTSQTANKKQQMAKEERIRNAGGSYVRDKKTKELIDVKDVPTRVVRHD